MPLSIVVPENARFFDDHAVQEAGQGGAAPRDRRADALCWSISKCPRRSLLFYEETFTGFVVHTAPLGSAVPDSVFVTLAATYDVYIDGAPPRGLAPPLITIQPSASAAGVDGTATKSNRTEAAADLVWRGASSAMHGARALVSIWKFSASAGCPRRETNGRSGGGPGRVSRPPGAPEVPGVGLENLLAELNHGVLGDNACPYALYYKRGGRPGGAAAETPKPRGPGPVDGPVDGPLEGPCLEDESASLVVATSAPLQLKLRTTKPGSRSDLLLTTLRVEAAALLVHSAPARPEERYALRILGLQAGFKGGQLTQLGDVPLPHRCALLDVLSVTYRLVNSDICPGPAAARLIDIRVRACVDKHSVLPGGAAQDGWVQVTREILTTWTPILDFDRGPQSPAALAKTHAPQGRGQLQFRSKSTHLKPLPPPGTFPQRPAAFGRNAGAMASPIASPGAASMYSLYSPRPGWPDSMPPEPLRPATPSLSSPLLPMPRGAASRMKTSRSAFAAAGGRPGFTLNLGPEAPPALAGLRLSFSGSPRIDLGHTVTWKAQAVNQTSHVLKLALVTSPARRKAPLGLAVGFYSSATRSSSHHSLLGPDDRRPANGLAIHSRLLLYEQYVLGKPGKAGVVLLSNDVALGVLEPNQVFESEFLFVSFTKGVHNLSGLLVAESTTGEAIDIVTESTESTTGETIDLGGFLETTKANTKILKKIGAYWELNPGPLAYLCERWLVLTQSENHTTRPHARI
ncbi:hypothetical protein METBIDRAFT_10219 [Metschnikowia bicuspidata var. bicuspidata NRRL YB-4993]|uniref:Trafficking protein particle complex II-specific subunit 65 IgD3 domain-containing protein n=1 Tax=Metschnikowia bicuspidata var. bicuspidata NRRL YB-4993 TaxID=869754 RepID=A0A1A0HJL5_9ASCO|nr:hypothetical protein METBIDRAFT_10219 [Metschnikowia bicuspidata var. bicuspidata NRRL YB-4993]OBA24028.1 hypothetical protein METBIDRAFT_10219 [Metschnikowia bicuspidata var. bicuspidata NRRL YB-4993]